MIQAFPSHAAQEALTGGVLPGRAIGRPPLDDAGGRSHAGEDRPVFAVVVADEVPRMLPERRGLAQLLGDPGIRRAARDADVDDPPRAERDHEERVHRPEAEIRDGEEIAGPDVRGVVAQEGRPCLTRAARRARLPQVALDRALAHADVELQ